MRCGTGNAAAVRQRRRGDEFPHHSEPWHWWALAVLLLALELVAPTSFFLWPAVAAAIIGIVLWFAPHIGAVAQVLGFLILATAAITAWRLGPWRKHRHPGAPLLNERAAQYVGRRATVVEAFRN